MQMNSAATVAALLATPAARALVVDREKKVAAERTRNANAMEMLQADAAESYHAHIPKMEAAMDKVHKLESALRAARGELGQILRDRGVESWRADLHLSALENELRKTSDPQIDEFLRELEDAAGATMRATPIPDGRVLVNQNTGKKTVVNDRPLVTARMRLEAIREARAKAEGLKLEADQTGVPAKLAEMRAGLPIVGEPVHE
jgi:hypothetical protein